ncbi:MAG: MATE family efflux transporter [Candidatus Krumholzibacteria bacterium]|nr:MATE family efflux transporter [Candidatus Krumholzibacteria bacterium]
MTEERSGAGSGRWKAVLTEGPVGRTLARLTVPMVAGILGMVAFNLTDTFFVGRLGTTELAALSFTFPFVLVLVRFILGIGIGASALISRAVGRGDAHEVRRVTTDSLSLALLLVVIFVAVGFPLVEPVFRALGADGEILPLVKTYMSIWLAGLLFVFFPMVGNNAIRANGDTKKPALIMLTAVCVNIILDYLLIFGIGPFPRLGLAGAALATVISRMITFTLSFYIVYFRLKMLTFERVPLSEVLSSWKKILFIGMPAAMTRVIAPIGIGVITSLIARTGPKGVAAFGVASRVEFFAIAVVFALSSVLNPFTGQNWGAAKNHRVKKGISLSNRFAFLWGVGMFVLLAALAGPIASIFSRDPEVVSMIVLYIRIVAAAYCMYGVFVICSLVLNVLHRPIHAAMLAAGQTFILTVPMAWAGMKIAGPKGIFAGIGVSYVIAGFFAWLMIRHVLSRLEESG